MPIIFFFSGVTVVAVGIGFLHISKVNKSWTQTVGVVIETKFDYTTFSTSGFAPPKFSIVEYDVGGIKYRVTDKNSTLPWPSEGDTRKVRYDPFNPANAKLEPNSSAILPAFIFPPLGIILISISIYLFIK